MKFIRNPYQAPAKTVSYPGKITGIYPDNQSRMLVEVAFSVNGEEKQVKKQLHQLGFKASVGQAVLVDFVPTKSGIMILLKEKRNC